MASGMGTTLTAGVALATAAMWFDPRWNVERRSWFHEPVRRRANKAVRKKRKAQRLARKVTRRRG
jgi:hypothetical protein